MKIFKTYYFNIIEKMDFKDTKPYLDKMFSEIGLAYKNISFLLSAISNDVCQKAIAKFPQLEKYSFYDNSTGLPVYGLTSFTANWQNGEIHAEKEDYDIISTIFSKTPRPYNFTSCKLILDGINWFKNSDDSISVNHNFWYRGSAKIPLQHELPYKSNRITMVREFGDKNKRNQIYITIDLTSEKTRQNCEDIINKLTPYLGEPKKIICDCIFSQEETEKFRKLEYIHRDRLNAIAKDKLPVPKPTLKNVDSHRTRIREHLPNAVNQTVLNKVFNGTGFSRQKGNPNWLHIYYCKDNYGFLYEAYIEKSMAYDVFSLSISVSGYNFKFGVICNNYIIESERENGCFEILQKFAEFCMMLRDEYSINLVKDFGITPEWYYDKF